MNVVEKYGAEWYWNKSEGDLVFELYEEKLDLIGAIHEKPTGLFSACLYEKVKDHTLVSPIWNGVKPDALFDDLIEAKAYVKALIANRL